MTMCFELPILVMSVLIDLSTQSIAGVTYMDHFDFEERYRNVYECDPFHWYPLHLPDHCMKMYSELIRAGIAANSPMQIVKEREDFDYSADSYSSEETYIKTTRHRTPHEKLLKMLKNDVEIQPSDPVITALPGLGLVALYNQPVSKKSRKYIKKIAALYREANTVPSSKENEDNKIEKIKKNLYKSTSKDGRVVSIFTGK